MGLSLVEDWSVGDGEAFKAIGNIGEIESHTLGSSANFFGRDGRFSLRIFGNI